MENLVSFSRDPYFSNKHLNWDKFVQFLKCKSRFRSSRTISSRSLFVTEKMKRIHHLAKMKIKEKHYDEAYKELWLMKNFRSTVNRDDPINTLKFKVRK